MHSAVRGPGVAATSCGVAPTSPSVARDKVWPGITAMRPGPSGTSTITPRRSLTGMGSATKKKDKAAVVDPAINVALSEMRDMVGALSDQSKQDIVFFSSVAQDLRKTTEMLVTESSALKVKYEQQQLSIDHLERALFNQHQDKESLLEQLSNLGAAHSALEVAYSPQNKCVAPEKTNASRP